MPRLVNTLCETAMMAAFTADRDHVLVEDVEAAVEELQWPEFAERRSKDRAATAPRQPVPTPRARTPPPPDASARPRAAVRGCTSARTTPARHEAVPDTPLAKLIVVTDGRTVGELPLRIGRTIIGRTPDNDLQIDSRFVSRHHCQIITKPNACIVEDLNSTNGIMVKSKRVRRHNLNDGDVITIGRHDLIYIDERTGTRSSQTGSHPAARRRIPPPAAHGETQVL